MRAAHVRGAPLPRPGFRFPSARATAATTGPRTASGSHGRDALGTRGVAPGLRLQLQQLPAHRRRLPALLLGRRHLPVGRLGPPPPAAAARGRRLADARPAARARGRRETGGSRARPTLRRRGRRRLLLGPARPAAPAVAGGRRGPGAGLQPGRWRPRARPRPRRPRAPRVRARGSAARAAPPPPSRSVLLLGTGTRDALPALAFLLVLFPPTVGRLGSVSVAGVNVEALFPAGPMVGFGGAARRPPSRVPPLAFCPLEGKLRGRSPRRVGAGRAVGAVGRAARASSAGHRRGAPRARERGLTWERTPRAPFPRSRGAGGRPPD